MRLYTSDEADRSWYRYYKIERHKFRCVCVSCKWFVELLYGYNCGNKVSLSRKWYGHNFENMDTNMYYCRLWNRNELLP